MDKKGIVKIIYTNYRISIRRNLILGIILLFIITIFRETANLNERNTAEYLEQAISFLGILILTPLSSCDMHSGLRDVLQTKKISLRYIYLIRNLLGIGLIVILSCLLLIYLKLHNCTFPFIIFCGGTVSTLFFLGEIGFFATELCNNVVAGYLAAIGYYLANAMGIITENCPLYLFSMESGNVQNKLYLLVGAIVLLFLGIYMNELKRYLV